jgi:hypothetical protein
MNTTTTHRGFQLNLLGVGIAGLLVATQTFATSTNYSIGINFASDQRAEDLSGANPIVVGDPNSGLSSALNPTDVAGAPGGRQMKLEQCPRRQRNRLVGQLQHPRRGHRPRRGQQ